jgi:hypothetical protein
VVRLIQGNDAAGRAELSPVATAVVPFGVQSADATMAKAQVSTRVVRNPVVPCEVRFIGATAHLLYVTG